MPTRIMGSWQDGQIRAEADYDSSDRVTALRVINTSDVNAYLEIVQGETVGTPGRKYGATFLAGTTTEIPIGTTQTTRILQQWDAGRGRWDGVYLDARIPA